MSLFVGLEHLCATAHVRGLSDSEHQPPFTVYEHQLGGFLIYLQQSTRERQTEKFSQLKPNTSHFVQKQVGAYVQCTVNITFTFVLHVLLSSSSVHNI